MSIAQTIPAVTRELRIALSPPMDAPISTATFTSDFEKAKPLLVDRPLRRPNRTRPHRDVDNEELKRLAASHPPPDEWFEGEEEKPF